MHFKFNSYSLFSKHWWFLLLATILVTVLTSSLGFWQLSRAQLKESLYASELNQNELPALKSEDFNHSMPPEVGLQRRVDLEGKWLSEWTIFLENRPMRGQPGYWILTPLKLDSGQVLLVQRGWVLRNLVQGNVLPKVDTPNERVRVLGRWVPAPSKILELSDNSQDIRSSKFFRMLRQNIDMEELSRETGLTFSANVLQLGEPSDGLYRDWPLVSAGSEKNRAYAFQWFVLSALCIGLFLWFQVFKKIRYD